MSAPAIGKKAPVFKAAATSDDKVALADLKGQNVVLYFYPRDNTPGCTTEGLDFNANLAKFKRANTVILGVSQDSISSHEKFCDKQGFKFALLSDEDGKICQKYDVIKLKKMYGKEFLGLERSTFLIDSKGVLRQEWRKVKVAGHVLEVLDAVKQLNKNS